MFLGNNVTYCFQWREREEDQKKERNVSDQMNQIQANDKRERERGRKEENRRERGGKNEEEERRYIYTTVLH